MSKKLPYRGFRWMTKEELSNWRDMPCILEVDLSYPEHLHDLHNDYPLAPENVQVGKVSKLIPNLHNKERYTIHHENLKYYLEKGLVLTKIHRGITFEESNWMESYISLNTKLRAQATNDFEKEFFKLMNNAVYGKTLENVRNHVDVKLVTSKEEAKKWICKPNFSRFTIYNKHFAAIHMLKKKVVQNKPRYVGFTVLELSKLHMYNFHYNYIIPKYGDRAKLLFTDTDSLMYEIETDDFYKDIAPDVHDKFDTSNDPKDHPSGIETGVSKETI